VADKKKGGSKGDEEAKNKARNLDDADMAESSIFGPNRDLFDPKRKKTGELVNPTIQPLKKQDPPPEPPKKKK